MKLKIFNPSFNSGEFLTSEKLIDLRDSNKEFLKIKYADYGDGIIYGFNFIKINKKILLEEGLLKLENNFLYLTQKYEICFDKNSRYHIFVEKKKNNYEIKVAKELSENCCFIFAEIEYTGGDVIILPNYFVEIEKIKTNFINTLKSYSSIKGGSSLTKSILNLYGKEYLLKYSEVNEDYLFALSCLSDNLTKEFIDLYMLKKSSGQNKLNDNIEVYKTLKSILLNQNLKNDYKEGNKKVNTQIVCK
jgi:hypothetical protein